MELAVWEYQMRQVVKKISRQSIINHKAFDVIDMGADKMEAFMGENFEEDMALLLGAR